MIFPTLVLMILIPPARGPAGLQGPGGYEGPRFVIVQDRPSSVQIKQQKTVVVNNRRVAALARHHRDDSQSQVNAHAVQVVAVAPKRRVYTPPPVLGEETDIVTEYVANVTIPVVNEKHEPAPGLKLEYSETGSRAKSSIESLYASISPSVPISLPMRTASSGEGGELVVKNLHLPNAVQVKLIETDWSIADNASVVGIVIPPNAQTSPYRKGEKRTFVAFRKQGKGRIKVFKCVHVDHIKFASAEPVVVRREVADFALQPPSSLPAGAGKPRVFVGEEKEGSQGLQYQTDSAGRWCFQVRRDTVGEKDAKVIIQYDTSHGGFGGEVQFANIDFYHPNVSTDTKLGLESVRSVEIADRAIDSHFPLSPLQWQTKDSERPVIRTGSDALMLLNLGKADYKEVEPGPGNEKRYGSWIILTKKGLQIHCRKEDDKSEEALGKKLIPGSDKKGLIEAVRVTAIDSGSVGGVLRVGASKSDVRAAFGEPDRLPYDLSVIGLNDPVTRNRRIYGDDKIEAWDDTFIYGGIRVKWDADKVKWFEIARPVQLLENGTRAFEPPVQKTVALGQVRVNPQDYTERLRSDVRALLGQTGLKPVDQTKNPDVIVDVGAVALVAKSQVQHQYSVGRKSYNEGFMCEQGAASAVFQVKSRETGSGRHLETDPNNAKKLPSNSASTSTLHVEHQQCQVSDQDLIQLREQALFQRKSIGLLFPHPDLLSREIVNQCSELSDMAGTVVAINYQTGQMLINLGSNQGVHTGDEVTEMDLYLLSEVNPKTGAGTNVENIKKERLMGKDAFNEWLEVQRVGPNWCVAIPTEKKHDGRGTGPAYGAMVRLVDPGSGLLRVRIRSK